MSDVAQMLAIPPVRQVDLINHLEQERFVSRVREKTNKRVIRIVPTHKGEERIL